MEPEGSLLYSQEPATCPYPEPTSSSPHNSLQLPEDPASQQLQLHLTHTKPASVVPPEDGRLTPETCRRSRHNKVIVKVKVY
jgi:hypothetical protein